jgi:hypothetical protein
MHSHLPRSELPATDKVECRMENEEWRMGVLALALHRGGPEGAVDWQWTSSTRGARPDLDLGRDPVLRVPDIHSSTGERMQAFAERSSPTDDGERAGLPRRSAAKPGARPYPVGGRDWMWLRRKDAYPPYFFLLTSSFFLPLAASRFANSRAARMLDGFATPRPARSYAVP